MAMNNNFEKNVKQQLDLSLTTLDAMTQSQLTQARYTALEHAETKRFNLGRWFTGIASVAVIALLVITVMPTMQIPDNLQQANLQLATGPEWVLVSDMDEIELYQDLEFYQWLDDNAGSNS
jgi:hypothetical protein